MNMKKIYDYLRELEITNCEKLTNDKIKSQFFLLAKIYHPDVAEEIFKDGKKFSVIKESANFLSNNLNYVNAVLSGKEDSPYNYAKQNFSQEYNDFNAEALTWINIKSENIHLVAYEKDKKILYISFVTSQKLTYYYHNINVDLYEQFLNAQSPESFLVSKIMLHFNHGIIHG